MAGRWRIDSGLTMGRREFLSGLAGAAILGAASPFLAACAASEPSPTGSPVTGPTTSPRPGGTLRLGMLGGSSADTLDIQSSVTYPDFARGIALYSGLARYNADLELETDLAEFIEPREDAMAWRIRVKEDVTFHHGKTLTADDVIFSLARIIDGGLYGSIGLTAVDLKNIKKLDERTIEVPLTQPSMVVLPSLAIIWAYILPEDYDPNNPVGTGPFMFKSFEPGRESTFVRNPDYFVEGKPYVDELIITNFDDDNARLNALLGGQLHLIDQVPFTQVSALEASAFKIVESQTSMITPFTMRVDEAPFDDVRVRQAMRLLIDRQQMIDLAVAGRGRLGNDLFGRDFPCFDPSLPEREQDLDQATSLLRAAGYGDLSVELVTSNVAPGLVEAAQVFAQQARSAGVKVTVNRVTPGEFYGDNYLSWVFAQDFWISLDYLLQVAYSMLPGSFFNETHWNDERYVKLYEEANRTLDDGTRCEIVHEMQRIDYEEGAYIIPYHPNIVDAHSSAIEGVVSSKTGLPLNSYRFEEIWFTA